MGIRYGKLDKREKFKGVTGRDPDAPKPTAREKRIRRGDDAFSESLAGIEREAPEKPEAKNYVDKETGEWVE